MRFRDAALVGDEQPMENVVKRTFDAVLSGGRNEFRFSEEKGRISKLKPCLLDSKPDVSGELFVLVIEKCINFGKAQYMVHRADRVDGRSGPFAHLIAHANEESLEFGLARDVTLGLAVLLSRASSHCGLHLFLPFLSVFGSHVMLS